MKRVKSYLRKRKKKILFLLKTPRLKCTPETFHDLRIELKKLRSVLSLIKYSAPGFKRRKVEKPFRRLFKLAGEIREIHVEEKMLERYFSVEFLHAYRQKLKGKKSGLLRRYTALINAEEAELKKSLAETETWISLVSKEKITGFIQKKADSIRILLDAENILPFRIHLLRKRIKQYHHSLRFSKEPVFEVKEGKKLSDLAGKWHDGQVLVSHLDSDWHNQGVQPAEGEQIEKVRNEQMVINKMRLNQIRSLIRGIEEQESSVF